MKKIKTTFVALVLMGTISQTAIAAEIPLESAPCNATKESIAVTENLIGGILTEVQNGMGYGEANGKAQAVIAEAVIENKTDGYGYGELMSIARNSLFLYRDMYLRPEYYKAKSEEVYSLISDLVTDVVSGRNYNEALDEAYIRIYKNVDNNYTINTEFVTDRIYLDIPAADFVMFTQARKILLEAVPGN